MPHKHNDDRRHHIPKMAFKIRNWPEYEAGPRRRGSLTLWIEDAALDHWQTVGPEGQARYTDAAIRTTLMVRTAFTRVPADRRSHGIGHHADGPDAFGAGSYHDEPPGGDIANDRA